MKKLNPIKSALKLHDDSSEKFSEEFTAQSPASAERFATEEATAAGVTLEPKAARALVGFVRKQVDALVEEGRWAPRR